jgi:PhoPQ-activated pathogenicity-related protein
MYGDRRGAECGRRYARNFQLPGKYKQIMKNLINSHFPALLKVCVALGLLASASTSHAAASDGDLARYVSTPDPSYAWREVSTGRIGSTDYAELALTSQTWRGILWRHQLFVIRPANVDPSTKQAFLYIHGGRWKQEYEAGQPSKLPGEARIFARLAESLRAPVVVVRQVPFQPLWDRTEDALIAYTFANYLQSGEADWPLLLPMVKSAVRAMDAAQEQLVKKWQLPVERFTVSGASKRGWTSWLTAAIDPRVASVAPMVIDMLNMPAQIQLQKATFGELSEQVEEYSRIDLPSKVDTDAGRKLLAMVDPYSYREQLNQPKLILLGTNDRYWPLDALKLYWNGLSASKNVLYVPNQGHGIKDITRLIQALSAFHRYSARGQPLPQVFWNFKPEERRFALNVTADRAPHKVMAWTASSPTRDFRDARWASQPCQRSRDNYICAQPLKGDRYVALYAEVAFRDRGESPFSLSTAACIAGGPDRSAADCLKNAPPAAATTAQVGTP